VQEARPTHYTAAFRICGGFTFLFEPMQPQIEELAKVGGHLTTVMRKFAKVRKGLFIRVYGDQTTDFYCGARCQKFVVFMKRFAESDDADEVKYELTRAGYTVGSRYYTASQFK
jgi:hypothetical protein